MKRILPVGSAWVAWLFIVAGVYLIVVPPLKHDVPLGLAVISCALSG